MDLIDTKEAAAVLGVSRGWLEQARAEGKGPRFLRIGGLIRYRPADLSQFLEASIVETEDTRKTA